MLKKLILGFSNNRKKKKETRSQPLDYNHVKSICLLLNEQDMNEKVVKFFKDELKLDGKELDILIRGGKDVENLSSEFEYYNGQDIDTFGKIKSEGLNSLVNRKYDLLIVLDTICDEITRFIINKIGANFVAGVYTEYLADRYDFALKPSSLENQDKELLKYLRQLS